MNRHDILQSIQQKTRSEYEQLHVGEQDQYREANKKWPHLSEYGEQFVLGTTIERKAKTEYVD